MMPRESVRIYVPHDATLPSGRIVRAGRYDAVLQGDGRALIRVKRFELDASLERYNEDLRERWTRPAAGGPEGTAGVLLTRYEFEMAGEAIESPIDRIILDLLITA